MPAITESPHARLTPQPRPRTMPPVTGPGRASSRTRHRLAAAAGGLLAAGAIVLASAAASGASPVSGAAGTGTTAASAPTALAHQVNYRVQQLHNPGGPAAAVIVELLDAAGNNVSEPGITLTVTGLSPRPGPGLAPVGTFTSINLGLWPCYRLQVDTAGYPPGTYTLSFTAGTDPATHAAQFTVP